MTQMIKEHKRKLFPAGLLAGIVILAMVAINLGSGRNIEARRIVLVGKDVAFYLADQPDRANPDLPLKKGQTVELVIRNEEPDQVLHCFIIGGLDVKTTGSLETGQSEMLVFTPERAGTFTYACLMHPAMAGRVVVE